MLRACEGQDAFGRFEGDSVRILGDFSSQPASGNGMDGLVISTLTQRKVRSRLIVWEERNDGQCFDGAEVINLDSDDTLSGRMHIDSEDWT